MTKSTLWIALAGIALLVVGIPVYLKRQAEANLLSDASWRFVKSDRAKGRMQEFRPDELPYPKAYRFLPGSFSDGPEEIVFENVIGGRLEPGKPITLRFWGRSASQSSVALRLQGEGPRGKIAWERFRPLTPKWHFYRYTFTPKDIGDGRRILRILLGGEAGAIDLAQFQLNRGVRETPD